MIGQTISHYTILEKIGEGGMGVVYKAEDTTLKRIVALKFLPPHVAASDSDRARFLLEAQAAAALSHPNICTIFGIEETDGHSFIAMEYVEGQTLREKRGTITLAKAIDIGIQVAEGLSVAHEKGIVHRDIKPENIMVRKDGLVQIMDFGLAKLRASRASRLTKEGSTVGTAGYMSPEQVQGQETDHRSDIFSVGVLLYELFTGEPPFKGVHETALLYEIVNVDPAPMSSVKPEIDPELDRIVLECLQKEPDERYNSMKDVAKDLKRFKRESSKQRLSRTMSVRPALTASRVGMSVPAPEPASARFPVREMIAWGVAAVLLAAAIYLFARPARAPSGPLMLIRSSIVTPDSIYIHSFGAGLGAPALSPDGRAIAFAGVTPDGTQAIYLRMIDEMETRMLPGTEGGSQPFWSPDGKYVGFFDTQRMKKVDIVGGSPTTIAVVPNPRGGTWAADGTIVFTPDYQAGLFRLNADGTGKAERVTSLDSTRHEGSHRWPQFLPDGKHVLYLARAASETGEAEGDAIYVSSLDGTEKKMLVQSSFNPTYAGGYLFFARSEVLMAQRFDLDKLTLEGDPVKVQEGILTDVSYNMAVYTLSHTGMLLYQTGKAEAGARPILVDRSGKVVHTINDRSEQDQVRYSPDGKEAALYLYDTRSRRSNIWIYDLKSDNRRRLTTGAKGDFYPVWSANGSEMFYSIGGSTQADIFVQPSSRSGGEKLFASVGTINRVLDASPDGKTLLLTTFTSLETKTDLWLVPTSGETRTPVQFQHTKFKEDDGRISHDGRWVAYVSDESGESEVYLKLLAEPSSNGWKVTSGGATLPLWGPSGTELLYVNTKREVVSATIKLAGNAGEVVSTKVLFVTPPFAQSFDISPDGTTFFITRSLEMEKYPSLSLVTNWEELLKKQ